MVGNFTIFIFYIKFQILIGYKLNWNGQKVEKPKLQGSR